MCIRNNYIQLYYNTPEETWYLSYNRDGDYFTCDNGDNNKITKLKNVQSFIRIQCVHKKGLPYVTWNEEGSVSLYIGNKCLSRYLVSKNALMPSNIIQEYIDTLKDVIEEKDGK